MIIHSEFESTNGEIFLFRRVLPNASLSGVPGVVAFTHIPNVTVEALKFEPANDLACIQEAKLKLSATYRQFSGASKIGIAVLLMPKSTEDQRHALANSLNDALPTHSKAA